MQPTKLLLLSVILLLAACTPIQPGATPPAAATPPTSTENRLANTQWQLVSFGTPGAEASVVGDKPVTLAFRPDGQAVGSGGCNSFGGQYQVQGPTLSISQVISTKMACVAQGVTEQETRYFQALAAAGPFVLADHHLTIQYDNGQGVLNFTPASSVATPPANETPIITATVAPTTTLAPSDPPERVNFASGATSAQFTSLLPSGPGVKQYVLAATAGQAMTVDVTSDGVPLSLTIESPDGNRTIPEMMPMEGGYRIGHVMTLPETGDYLVTLGKGDHTPSTNYTATFTIVRATGTPPPTPAGPALDDRSDPTALLASYIDAINRKEYPRAYGYWETPPNNQSLAQFTQGFADTAAVDLLINPPAHQEGAAGSVYASIPTVLIATHTDHITYLFAGCYVARRSNQSNGNAPENNPWRLYRGDLTAAPAEANLITLLQQACPAAPPVQGTYNNLSTPVDLLASFVDALNRKEYRRAYDYWETPPDQQTFDQFAQGYAKTASVFLAVHLPTQNDVGAGQQYAGIPAWLVATHTDGTKPNFIGCYVAHRPNPNIPGAPKSGDWHLSRATVNTLPAGADPVELLKQACVTQ